MIDIMWLREEVWWLEGDVFFDGIFVIDVGIVEIDFFCGVILIVEGFVSFLFELDWVVCVL